MAKNLMVRVLAVSILCFLFSSCEEENKGDLIEPVPVVQTLPVVWTSATAAVCGGIIDGEANVTKRGLVWSTSPNPKITDSKSDAGLGNGEFTSTLTSISNSNSYYVRAYAETNSTVVYGNEVILAEQGPASGSISELNCSLADNSGTLCQGSLASGVSTIVYYYGGNGGNYYGQTVSSTGVQGLTATLNSGFFANGNGSITYTISGTPSSGGTASFLIYIGGKSCTITRTVIGNQSGISQHSCGTNNVHNSSKTYGFMIDQEGTVYRTIVIGTQEWMAENLQTSIYRNGDPILNINDYAIWPSLASGAWCNYNYDNLYECPYGKLYNWYAISDSRDLCPVGWHVPTDSEWSVLTSYLGGETLAGSKMKSTSNLWTSPNQSAVNSSGFSGLPSGVCAVDGMFYLNGERAIYWSSSEADALSAWARGLFFDYGNVGRGNDNKNYGFSVRCVKD